MLRHALCVAGLILAGFGPLLAVQGADKPAPAVKNLFNGKTLEGWKVTDFGGEGKVVVRDGAIVMQRGNQMTGITWTGTRIFWPSAAGRCWMWRASRRPRRTGGCGMCAFPARR